VIDLSAFLGNEPTPQNAASRLLLIGTRYGTNAALLVTRMVGLRYVDALTPQAPDGRAPAWAREAYTDNKLTPTTKVVTGRRSKCASC